MSSGEYVSAHLRRCWREALQRDFPCFLEQAMLELNGATAFRSNWHIDLLAEYLQSVEKGQIRRLLINIPPRYLKSFTVSVAWPAWLLGQNAARRVLVASYAQSLSLKHSLDCRHILQSAWYRYAYPATRIQQGQNEKHKFVTDVHGFRLAVSVGGAVTGEGGDVLIVDDPLNPQQAESRLFRNLANRWFEQTFSSRLNDKRGGAMVVVMQRLHAQDLSGLLLEKGGWEHLSLPAIAPETRYYFTAASAQPYHAGQVLHAAREDAPMLEKLRHEMGSYAFAAQYLQSPTLVEGGLVKREWFGRFTKQQWPCFDTYVSGGEFSERGQEAEPFSGEALGSSRRSVDRSGGSNSIIQSWDTALKAGAGNDPSVCLTFGCSEGRFYLLDVLAGKLEYPQLRRRMMELAERWNPQAILIEDKASGQSLLQDLRQSTCLPVIACQPKLDKMTRFAQVTPLIEAGRVLLPEHAPWLAAFEQEVLAFPEAPHDDQVDALSQFLNWQRSREHMGKLGIRRM